MHWFSCRQVLSVIKGLTVFLICCILVGSSGYSYMDYRWVFVSGVALAPTDQGDAIRSKDKFFT